MSNMFARPRNISELPRDIVCNIFDCSAFINPPCWKGQRPDNLRLTYNLGWIALTHVCAEWRAVALDMPSLWAQIITTFKTPDIARELASRACHRNLDLEIFNGGGRDPLFDIAIELAPDARSLSIWQDENDDDAFRSTLALFSSGHLQVLESMTYRFGSNTNPDFPAVVPLHAPRLVTATLTGIFPASSSLLRNLRALRVLIYSTQSLSIHDVTLLLSELVRLERLSLFYHGTLIPPNTRERPTGIVLMGRLTELDLTIESTSDACVLLESIEAPVATAVSVKVPGDDEHPDVLSRFWGNSISPYIARQRFTTLAFGMRGVHLLGQADSGTENASRIPRPAFTLHVGRSYIMDHHFLVHNAALPFHTLHRCELRAVVKVEESDTELIAQYQESQQALIRGLAGISSLMIRIDSHGLSFLRFRDQDSPLALPALSSLEIVFERGLTDRTTEEERRSWWDKVQAILQCRVRAGGALKRLVLKGKRRSREPEWAIEWLRRAGECQTLGLVQTCVDMRVISTQYSINSNEMEEFLYATPVFEALAEASRSAGPDPTEH
ncbi:hypothetical protein PENSPDRAFT_682124 [Peniophora sp. CONT]|nr:hypothetical protein PENSPDRAFT_682124 [Peniophora sp. CONT]